MGLKRYELKEAQWMKIAPTLPGKASDADRTGSDNRLFVNGCYGFCSLVHTGVTCPNAMARGRRCIAVLAAGVMRGFGNGYSRH